MTEDLGSETLAAMVADEGAFFATYQPVVSLADGTVVGFETSLGARRATREVPPAELFAMARTPAAVQVLDRLGREVALRDANGWLGDRLLFVRLLPEMLSMPAEALTGLDAVAATAGVRMSQVVIEVPLPRGQDALVHLARVVTRCRGGGCQVAVVDVGDAATVSGSAAMVVPDFVKLGRGLLSAGGEDAAARMVEAVHAAGARVIAFGVEDEAHAVRAAGLGAELGQGWYFGRPGTREMFAAG